jgi:Cu-Zn family superoxide dismutase
MRKKTWAIAAALIWTSAAGAEELTVEIHKIDDKGIGAAIGSVAAKDGKAGLELTPNLRDLPAGQHGFHVHENANCGPGEKDGKVQAGLAAGSHFDPEKTGKHLGPTGTGHLGDLPPLSVAEDGTAKATVTAPRLHAKDLKGRALVIHAEPDNFADKPGGARIACGTVAGQP